MYKKRRDKEHPRGCDFYYRGPYLPLFFAAVKLFLTAIALFVLINS